MTIWVSTDQKRAFRKVIVAWLKRQTPGAIIVEPAEGPPVGDTTPFEGVPEAALEQVYAAGIPFSRNRPR